MQGEHTSQNSFFGMIYEDLIPVDHLLRKLSVAVDFSFVSDLVRDCYCRDNGRPAWDPLVLFKVVFLPFGVLRAVSLSNGSRLGAEKFQEIFNEIIKQARAAGLVHDRLRIIDATHLQAKVDLFRLPSAPPGTPSMRISPRPCWTLCSAEVGR